MYPVILLGSVPGFLMALQSFTQNDGPIWALVAAFIAGQGAAYFLCRKYAL